MNPRHAAGLVSVLAGAVGLAGCSQPAGADGRLFERWADAVAAIPVDGGSHPAASKPAHTDPSPLKIDLTDHAEAPSAKALGLRAAAGFLNSELAGLRQKVSFDETVAAAAPAPAVPTVPTAPARSGGGSFMAQLAAFPTRAAAERGWTRLKASHPDVLGRVSARFESVDLGGRGVWTRVQAGPFPSRDGAAKVCSGIGAPERWCVVASRD